jgi:hypothetical protein
MKQATVMALVLDLSEVPASDQFVTSPTTSQLVRNQEGINEASYQWDEFDVNFPPHFVVILKTHAEMTLLTKISRPTSANNLLSQMILEHFIVKLFNLKI